jgi:hypothetical protein
MKVSRKLRRVIIAQTKARPVARVTAPTSRNLFRAQAEEIMGKIGKAHRQAATDLFSNDINKRIPAVEIVGTNAKHEKDPRLFDAFLYAFEIEKNPLMNSNFLQLLDISRMRSDAAGFFYGLPKLEKMKFVLERKLLSEKDYGTQLFLRDSLHSTEEHIKHLSKPVS